MKWTAILGATAAFVMLTGCDTPVSSLLSLEEVTVEQDAIMDPALLGVWATDSNHNNNDEFCVIRPTGENGYRIVYMGGGGPVVLTARLFAAGDARFLEVTPENDNDFLIPGHAIARVWVSQNELRWSFLDSDWFKAQAANLPHFASGKRTVFGAPAAAMRALIARNGADDQAYGAVTTWHR